MPLKVSIVTASYNQAPYLEETLKSVLGQANVELEYLVLDGGSTDGSLDILERYKNRLAYYRTGPDEGQYYAIQEGFERSTGDVMGWLNSDDKYLPGALSIVSEIFETFPDVEWITSMYPIIWDTRGRAIRCTYCKALSQKLFMRGASLSDGRWYSRNMMQQESTFWRRSLWEKAGGSLQLSYALAGDFELWLRFAKYASVHGVEVPLAGFRRHDEQKTGKYRAQYVEEAMRALEMHGAKPYGTVETALRKLLRNIEDFLPVRSFWSALDVLHASPSIRFDRGWQKKMRYMV